jgi:catechol 2,3-dioxygenase-like lactoylglutathione lyase family enzyme
MSTGIPRVKRVAHILLYVRDAEASAKWYCNVLGMRVSARVPAGPYAGAVFLTFGEFDHDIALVPAKQEITRHREYEHIGLEVDCAGDVDGLRRLYGKLLDHDVEIHEVLDHGVSKGIYFYDPDGHELEVFCQLTPPGEEAIRHIRAVNAMAHEIEFAPLR